MTPVVVGIPNELEKSAQIDGASRLQIFLRIVAPRLLLEWTQAPSSLPGYIRGFISARTLDWGPMASASSLAIIPIGALTVLGLRRLTSGLSAGALKD